MQFNKHRTYQIFSDDYPNLKLCYIPTLNKVLAFNKNTEIPDSILSELKIPENISNRTPTLLSLVLTKQCNMKCSYCHSGGSFNEIMSKDIINLSISEFIVSAFNNNKKKVELVLFGGEATLVFENILYAVKYFRKQCEKRGLHAFISLSTNGTYRYSEYINLLKESKIDFIKISFDGSKETHNKNRIFSNGKGSFNRVFKTVKKLYEEFPEKILIRATISENNIYNMIAITNFFINNFPFSCIRYEPALIKTDYDSIKSLYTDFADEFWKCFIISQKSGLKIFSSILDTFNKFEKSFCGLSGERLHVLPNGNTTACDRVYLNEKDKYFQIGKIGNYLDSLNQKFCYLDEFTKNNCDSCFAKFSCKGGCPWIKYKMGLNLLVDKPPYCSAIRRILSKYLFWRCLKINNYPN